MKITEIFHSIQGEGLLAGVPSVFVRLAGCPNRCEWCDTQYAWDETKAKEMNITEICTCVSDYNCSHVVITGGEPFVNMDGLPREDLPELTDALADAKLHITIESSATTVPPLLCCDLMSLSPKLVGVGPEVAMLDYDAILKKLAEQYNCQLKMVVETEEDVQKVLKLARTAGIEKQKVLLMPLARTKKDYSQKALDVAEMCIKYEVRFGTRLHLMLWDGERGK